MVRAFLLALSLVAGSAAIAPTPARAEAPYEAPPAFPLPKDAQSPQMTKGGGGRIQTYNVPRGKVAVTDELRAALKKDRWEIVKDEASPSGNATRIQAKKAGQLWKVSVTGDAQRSVIILTSP